jgi:hypothetical protein
MSLALQNDVFPAIQRTAIKKKRGFAQSPGHSLEKKTAEGKALTHIWKPLAATERQCRFLPLGCTKTV